MKVWLESNYSFGPPADLDPSYYEDMGDWLDEEPEAVYIVFEDGEFVLETDDFEDALEYGRASRGTVVIRDTENDREQVMFKAGEIIRMNTATRAYFRLMERYG